MVYFFKDGKNIIKFFVVIFVDELMWGYLVFVSLFNNKKVMYMCVLIFLRIVFILCNFNCFFI